MSTTDELKSMAKSLRGVSRENGTLYRSKDGETRATLFSTKYRGACDGCPKSLDPGSDVLGISKDEPRNPLGRWVIFCLDCAQRDFEPADKTLFAKSLTDIFAVRKEPSETASDDSPEATTELEQRTA